MEIFLFVKDSLVTNKSTSGSQLESLRLHALKNKIKKTPRYPKRLPGDEQVSSEYFFLPNSAVYSRLGIRFTGKPRLSCGQFFGESITNPKNSTNIRFRRSCLMKKPETKKFHNTVPWREILSNLFFSCCVYWDYRRDVEKPTQPHWFLYCTLHHILAGWAGLQLPAPMALHLGIPWENFTKGNIASARKKCSLGGNIVRSG
jgi:hypothetical protein